MQREDDGERRWHVVLHVVGVADGERRDRQEQRRRHADAPIEQPRAEMVDGELPQRAAHGAEQPPGGVDSGRIGEVQLLQSRH